MKQILILALLTACSLVLYAQDLKGRVIDASGKSPIPRASVLNQRTGIKTVTASDGSFLIGAMVADSLLISARDFRTLHVQVRIMESLVVQLEKSATLMDEVVVNTGYQIIPRERSTGSFAVIDNKTLNEQVSTNVLGRLESIASSVSVDKKSSTNVIMIRGNSTIRGNRQPLVIVDNFPYSGDINNINPNDVESVTILKDAAAASIWGARAANGVIVINLKKARINQPLKITLNANTTLVQEPDLHYLPSIAVSDFINVEQFLFSKGFRFADTAATSRPPFSPLYEMLFDQRRGLLTAAELAGRIDALRKHDIKDDLSKYFYHTGINQQYALNLQGGTSKYAWLLAGGLDRNTGTNKAAFERVTVRSEQTINPLANLSINCGIYYTQSKAHNGMPGYDDMRSVNARLAPYTRLADSNGVPLPVIKTYRQRFMDTIGAGKLFDWNYYPLEDYKHVSVLNTTQDLTIATGLNYRLKYGISFDLKYLYERQTTEGSNIKQIGGYDARGLINFYTQINRTTGQVTYRVPVGAILDRSNGLMVSQNLRAQTNYIKQWKQQQLYVLAGVEMRDVNTTGYISRVYGYNPDILRGGNVDFATAYPNIISGANSFIPNNTDLSKTADRFVSGFSNAALTLQKKYTLNASLRRDASNTFGVHTNDKWNLLWSSGISWDLSEESFYKWSAMPYLKLRATYGITGSVDPAMAAVTTVSYLSNSVYTQTPTARFDKFLNPELRWEKTKMFNVGLDFKTVNSRVAGSIEYYFKKGTDLYGTAAVDYTGVPASLLLRNVAAMKGRGFDVEINSINTTGQLKWQSQFQLSHATDRVTDFYLSTQQASSLVGSRLGYAGVKGRPVYSVFSYAWAGLDPLTGDPQGILDGQTSKDYTALSGSAVLVGDVKYHGASQPQIFGSIGNNLEWKGLSMAVRLTYKLNYYFVRDALGYSSLFNSGDGHAEFAKRWQQPGDEFKTNVPSMTYPAVTRRDAFYRSSEINVLKGDHLRLQYITLGYDLAPVFKKWVSLQSIHCFASVNNIGILWRANKEGIDPEYRTNSIPPGRTTSFGLKLHF